MCDFPSFYVPTFSPSTQVIFPPVALPSLPHGAAKNLTPAFTYMFVANLLHWPAGVVPVTLVRPDEEVRTNNSSDNFFIRRLIFCQGGGAREELHASPVDVDICDVFFPV